MTPFIGGKNAPSGAGLVILSAMGEGLFRIAVSEPPPLLVGFGRNDCPGTRRIANGVYFCSLRPGASLHADKAILGFCRI